MVKRTFSVKSSPDIDKTKGDEKGTKGKRFEKESESVCLESTGCLAPGSKAHFCYAPD